MSSYTTTYASSFSLYRAWFEKDLSTSVSYDEFSKGYVVIRDPLVDKLAVVNGVGKGLGVLS